MATKKHEWTPRQAELTAWHFVGDRLRDGRPVPPDGEELRHDGPLVMCKSGLHASRRLIDALQHAPGGVVCRVRVGGDMVVGSDGKLVATRRTILWRVEEDDLLRTFARRCALDVIHLWEPPEVVVRYLRTGDESIRDAAWAAARAVAWNAAWTAAWAAARAAARSAAWAAARAVAWAAARSAAGDAAWDAAWDAAGDAAWAAQNRRLTAMVSAARRQA